MCDDSYGYQPPVTNTNFRGRWPASGYAWKIAAEYPTDYRFNQLQAVIVTSNIPIRQETLPLSTGQAVQNPINPVSYISTLPVLTSFRTDVNQFGLQNSSMIYFNRGEYRWIDMMTVLPLDRLSFNFYWQSTDQTIHQLMLSPGESVIIRLYFRSIY
jgi:hypothetical protein